MSNNTPSSKILLALLMLFPFSVHAAMLLDIKVGGGIWDAEVFGNVNHNGTFAKVKEDLLLKDELGEYLFAKVEHPFPMIPNFLVRKYGIATTGGGTVTTGFTFGGTSYTTGDSITSELNLDHTDLTLYYQLLDNILILDLGITAMVINGNVAVTRSAVRNNKMIDTTIPMVYYNLGIEFPSGFKFEFVGDHIDMSDGYYCGLDTKIVYEPSQYYGFEFGFRDNKFKFDGKKSLYSDIDFEGLFFNAYLHF